VATDIGKRSSTRALFLQLAARHGWQDGPLLARVCRVARWAVWRGLHQCDEAALAAAELYLGDERRRVWRAPARPSARESHEGCDWSADGWVIGRRVTHFV
jgi:hypothetical protein